MPDDTAPRLPAVENDQALNLHPLTAKTAPEFFWRYQVSGGDVFTLRRLSRTLNAKEITNPVLNFVRDVLAVPGLTFRWLWRVFTKIPRSLQEDARRILWLLPALAIAFCGIFLLMTGAVLTLFFPGYLLTHGVRELERIPYAYETSRTA